MASQATTAQAVVPLAISALSTNQLIEIISNRNRELRELNQQIASLKLKQSQQILQYNADSKKDKSFNKMLEEQKKILEKIAKSKLDSITNSEQKKLFNPKFQTKVLLELNKLRKQYNLRTTKQNNSNQQAQLKTNIQELNVKIQAINAEYQALITKLLHNQKALKEMKFNPTITNGSLEQVIAEQKAFNSYYQTRLNNLLSKPVNERTNESNKLIANLKILKTNMNEIYLLKKKIFNSSYSPSEKLQLQQRIQTLFDKKKETEFKTSSRLNML